MKSAVSPELELICACLRWPLQAPEIDAIRQIAARPTDWDRISALALRHRVTGMVGHALDQAGVAPPSAAASFFSGQTRAVALAELQSAAAARRVGDRLGDAGIASRLIKGPAVAIAAFGRLGLRVNRDIDILVAPADYAASAAALAGLGYLRIEPPAEVGAAALDAWLRTHKDVVFRNSGGILLELHWRLFDNRHLLPGAMRGVPARVAAGPFRFDTLGPADNCLYLCVHGAQHAWARLKWLADVGALLRAMDEPTLRDMVALAGAERVWPAAAQALLLCEDHLGIALPGDLRARFARSWRVRLLVRIARRSMLAAHGREIEEEMFGSTFKSISHYLIATGTRYLLAELWFDLTDLSGSGLPDGWRRLGPLGRPLAWLWKRRVLLPAPRSRISRRQGAAPGGPARDAPTG